MKDDITKIITNILIRKIKKNPVDLKAILDSICITFSLYLFAEEPFMLHLFILF